MAFQKVVIVCMVLFVAVQGEEVVKVTYSTVPGGVSNVSLSRLEFSEYAMVVAASSYDYSEIKQVEFYDDRSVTLTDSGRHPIVVNEGKIGFLEKNKDLLLSLPSNLEITVSLYTLDGKNAATLFCGEAEEGMLDLNITEQGLASGAYSLVVKTENALFVRNLALR